MKFDRFCWLFALCFSLAPAGAQPYGLDSRPLVGPFLNGHLPATAAEAFPLLLSQTHAFTDTASLTPAPGLLPYTVNTALWSDGAEKWRWAAVPTNGTIGFAPKGPWVFPGGTVLVKHFELPVNETNAAIRKRLETRFLIRSGLGTVFGATYKWRADNTDADLLTSSLTENIVIQTPTGTRKQRWYYPSREDCLACHTPAAGYVLGPKTAQLNGDFAYSATGVTDNQLRVLNHLGLFTSALDEPAITSLPKMFGVTDATASLEQRARSYLDANCAHCHRPGGPAHANFDARFDTP